MWCAEIGKENGKAVTGRRAPKIRIDLSPLRVCYTGHNLPEARVARFPQRFYSAFSR
jgi:hypothetical protein